MNTKDTNTAFWRANIKARFDIAGISTEFNSKKGAFLVTALSSVGFPGQVLPAGADPNTYPDASTTQINNSTDAQFNRAVLNVADFMPAKDTAYYTPTANRRAFNLMTYLGYVDPGVPLDQTARRIYEADKKGRDDQQVKVDDMLEAAQTAYNAETSTPKPSFALWLRSEYPKRFALTREMNKLGDLQALLLGDAQRAFGPIAQALNIAIDNAKAATKPNPYLDGDFTMLCDQTHATYYYMGSTTYYQAYDSWQRNAAPVDAKPKLIQKIDFEKSHDVKLSDYGLDEGKVEAGLEFSDPFFFFGEGSYSTREEKSTLYNNNSFSSIKVHITCLGNPRMFPIRPGTWGSTDAKTAFPKLVSSAPPNTDDLLYPFVTSVVVGYGLGYKIELDQKSYDEFQSFIKKDQKGQVFGIFDIFFEGGGSGSSTETRSFSDLKFSDNDRTITVLPNKDMLATTLGVVIARDNTDVETETTLDLFSGDSSTFEDPEAPSICDCFTEFVNSLSEHQKVSFSDKLCAILRDGDSDKVAGSLANLIQSVLSGKDAEEQGNTAREKLTFKQTIGASCISIVVESGLQLGASVDNASRFEITSGAGRAIARAKQLLMDVDRLQSGVIQGYLAASCNLDSLIEPVIDSLAKSANIWLTHTRKRELVRPMVVALHKLAEDHSTLRPMFRGLLDSGMAGNPWWDQYTQTAAYNTITRTFPHFGGNKSYAIIFSRPDGSPLPFTVTDFWITIRMSDHSTYTPKIFGGDNAYHWFEPDAFTNVMLRLNARAYIPRNIFDQAMNYSLFEI